MFDNFSYKNLIVWQKSITLVTLVYQLTESFPKTEIYGLISQMRRSAVSIPSNIAEGKRRDRPLEFKRFLRIALGSAGELETQIIIAKKLNFGKSLEYQAVEEFLDETIRMLVSLTKEKQL